jgi:cation diffusion facilitator family transporter
MREEGGSQGTDVLAGAARTANDRIVGRVAFAGIVVSGLLVALTLTMAILTRSFAISATAVDCAVDVVAAVILYVGLKVSTRRSRRFPFGLYKVENLLQIAVSLLIFVAAYEIGRRALTAESHSPTVSWWTLVAMAFVVSLIWAYGRYASKWGKRTRSPALTAEGTHRRIDALSASVALAAVVSTYRGANVDRLAALPVLAFATYSGWGLLVAGMKVLLDASVDAPTLQRMRQLLCSDPLVERVDALAVRNAGRFVFVEATIGLRTDDLTKAHAVSERLEAEVTRSIPSVDRVVLHLEPRRREVLRAAVPLLSPDGEISAEFGEAPFFAFADVRTQDGQVLRQEVLENTRRASQRQKGILVAEWLVQQGIDVIVTARQINKGPSYVLREAGVDMRLAQTLRLTEELRSIAVARAVRPDSAI